MRAFWGPDNMAVSLTQGLGALAGGVKNRFLTANCRSWLGRKERGLSARVRVSHHALQ